MQKLVLVSILLVSILAPALAARERSPRLALQKALAWTLGGILLYVLAVLYIYPRFPS